ncbi:MAG: GWxTD domain-containing protein [Candidatus Omnitrophota bacterium]
MHARTRTAVGQTRASAHASPCVYVKKPDWATLPNLDSNSIMEYIIQMKIKKKTFITFILFIFTVLLITLSFDGPLFGAGSQSKVKEKAANFDTKSLDQPYRDWLDLVEYIITPTERDIFFKLSNNKDRNAFIDLFWKMRDPTKGTPENEFKDEHIRRFNYVNNYFKYGSPIPGWKTDRGRIYIILGAPVSQDEVSQNGLNPVLIWDFYGDVSKGMPTMYHIVFYKKTNSDPYRLYLPASDGPASLLRVGTGEIDANDYEAVYEKLREFNHSVANVSLSLIPGENLQGYTPSVQSTMLLAQVLELPKKSINTTYAQNFLNFKGLVETSVTTDYLNVSGDAYIIKDPILGLNFIHLAVLPGRLSVDYTPEKDKYYTNINMTVVLKKGDDIVFQYNRDFPLYYTKEELDNQLSNGLVLTDFLPIIEGHFKIIAILQNSVSKEICYYEKIIDTTNLSSNRPLIFGPMLSYQTTAADQLTYAAFNILGQPVQLDPKFTFGQRDNCCAYSWIDKGNFTSPLQVRLDIQSLDEKRPYAKTYTFDVPDGKNFEKYVQNLEKLEYGSYVAREKLMGPNGEILDTREKTFDVSPNPFVGHPPAISKNIKPGGQYLFYWIAATEYDNLKDYQKAESFYEKAFALNSTYPEILKSYGLLLLRLKKYDKVLAVIENLKGAANEAFVYFSLKGKASYYLNKYNEALDALLSANKLYDSDVTVLNTIGLCLIRLNNTDEAIKALSASLKIDEKQNEIQKLLQQLKSNKN